MTAIAAPHPERDAQLALLVANYTPKTRLRTADKQKIKLIKSMQQGYDGKTALCGHCKKLFPIELLQIHHIDHNPSNNLLPNLDLFDQLCNNTEHANFAQNEKRRLSDQPTVCARSSTSPGQPHAYERANKEAQEWESREGQKHDEMRFAWNKWLTDLEGGAFAKDRQMPFEMLAGRAVHALKMGSSVTYRRYIKEDYYGGVLDIFQNDKDLGRKYVKLAYVPETEKPVN